MYSELMKKFLETSDSDNLIGIAVVDRDKESIIDFSVRKPISSSDLESLSRAITKALKTYEAEKAGSDLVTMIFNTKDFTIIADDYQDYNKVLILLYNPNHFAIKFVGRNAEYLKQIIDIIKSK